MSAASLVFRGVGALLMRAAMGSDLLKKVRQTRRTPLNAHRGLMTQTRVITRSATAILSLIGVAKVLMTVPDVPRPANRSCSCAAWSALPIP
ncbi:MAG: hypothetical protein HY019_09405 [Aquabacterium sp.]|uniref:hypothetical protein n=1 Tax=Aquabacterium sp. TaxID=1872578 RepID=UPI0025C098B3|nr:hypothetical protein [Aquabacterium sp.]MBI3382207.1 hypothetical protein [Aquabacterium sp.]